MPHTQSAIPSQTPSKESHIKTLGSNGLVRIASAGALDKIDAEREAEKLKAVKSEQTLTDLSSYALTVWELHKRAKIQVETEILQGLQRKASKYTASKQAEIDAEGGSDAYFALTETKCRTAISWILDILFPTTGTRPFNIKATPIPDIPPLDRQKILANTFQQLIRQALEVEIATGQPINIATLGKTIKGQIEHNDQLVSRQVKRHAARRAKKMSNAIDDALLEGGFYEALREFVEDVVSMKAGVIGGPFTRRKRTKVWKQIGGKSIPGVEEKNVSEYERINALDVYPAPGAKTIQRGDLIIRHRYVRRDLDVLKGVPGYIDENIEKALSEFGMGGTQQYLWTDSEREALRLNNATFAQDTYDLDAIEGWLSVPGKKLIDFGMEGIDSETKEYEVNIIMVGQYVVKAVLNPDALGQRPYSSAAFIKNPDSIWGTSLPDSIVHDQGAANATYRASINNAAFSSGPVIEENIDRLETSVSSGPHPYKVYRVRGDQMATGAPAIRFYQPRPVMNELAKFLQQISDFADDHSNVPGFAHGNPNVGGAGETASGLSMLMGAASRGIKTVVSNIDQAIVEIVERTYDQIMLFNPDESLKGDINIEATGSRSQIVREQSALRRREILRDTNNPVDLAIVGAGGRKKLLSGTFEDMGMDDIFDDIDGEMPEMPTLGGMIPGQEPNPQTTDVAGNPAGGQDVNQFQNQKAS